MRLYEAVNGFRGAISERTRERVPLEWTTTQNYLGNALSLLGTLQVALRVVDDARDAASGIATAARFVVDAVRPGAEPA